MTRGVPGSNLPVQATTYANPVRPGRAGGGPHWWSGLIPWWGWVGLSVAFLALGGVAAISAFFAAIVNEGGRLIGLAALVLLVVGTLAALAGFGLKIIPHPHAVGHGHHMARNGAIAGLVGLFIIFGGLNVAWGVGAVLVSDVMTGVRSRVHLPEAPPALQVDLPTLAGATAPTPTPTPGR
jgi:hypothetical protein